MNPIIVLVLKIEAAIIFGLLIAFDIDQGGLVGTGIKTLFNAITGI
jgi:hypothetical protein